MKSELRVKSFGPIKFVRAQEKGLFFWFGVNMKQGKELLKVVLNPEIEHWRVDQTPSKDLMKSIEDQGQLQNIIARRLSNGVLEVIGGTRRFKALQALGKKPEEMDIKIVEDVSDGKAVLMAFEENLQRKDLSPIEEARAFETMYNKLRQSIEEIALRTKSSESFVRERLGLLELPDKIQTMMAEGKLSMRYAVALNKLANYPHVQSDLVRMILDHDYRVKNAEDAEQLAIECVKSEKHLQEIGEKYGPCPKCGGTRLKEEYYSCEKDKITCTKCGFAFDKKTKEPWKITQIRQSLEEIGMKVELKDGKATLTPESLTEVMKKHEKAIEEREKKPKQNFRSFHTLAELLAPFIVNENLLSLRVTGDKIEISLVQDSKIHFSARRHNYDGGEKSFVHSMKTWDESEEDFPKSLERLHAFEQSLKLE